MSSEQPGNVAGSLENEATTNASSGTGGMPRNPSRFQVNRVDSTGGGSVVGDESPRLNGGPRFQNGDEAIELGRSGSGDNIGVLNLDSTNPNNSTSFAKQVQFSVGMNSNAEEDDQHHVANSTINYGTTNLKSFRNVQTADRIPHQDHYRNVMSIEGAMAVRPTLADLHEQKDVGDDLTDLKHFIGHGGFQSLDGAVVKPTIVQGPKFGWIKGVLMRCILSILGTMLYLRVSWMTGRVGILYSGLIIVLSSVVTMLTTVSMCAICTNGEVKGGGAYFMISRSLGPEFGGSIGLIFSFANAVASGMCVVGFAEPLVTLLRDNDIHFSDSKDWDIRIIGTITIVVLLCICLVGVSFEAKMQLFLLVALTLSIIDYVIGTFLKPNAEQVGKGMTGYSLQTFRENVLPPDDFNLSVFFEVFSVFFPACTGIMAGANISGDLADPSTAIPKGTLLAIVITSGIYFLSVISLGTTVVRHASGIPIAAIDPAINSTLYYVNETCKSTKCSYGLLNSYSIWELEGAWLPLILAGIFAATLSSALGALVSAPKVFQAVCKDRLFPKIEWFAKGYGKADEPKRGYVLFFLVAFLMICIAELDYIALIITDFFLMCYALVNYACFDASFAGSPGFRPGFRYYNKWIALLAATLCMVVMFIINWVTALLSLAIVTALYVYILYRKPEVNWGSSSQAYSYKNALQSALRLAVVEDHVKNYRPQILVLTGNPVARQSLVDFVSSITKETSLMICGHVIIQQPSQKVLSQVEKFTRQIYHWLDKRRVKAFYCAVVAPSVREGAQYLLQASGVGKMRPNVLVLGMKRDWKTSTPDQILEYFNTLHDAFDNNCGLGILCVSSGLDFSESMREHQVGDTHNLHLPEPAQPSLAVEGSAVNVCESNRQLSVSDSVTQLAVDGASAPLLLPESRKSSTGIKMERARYDSMSSFAAKCQAAEEEKVQLGSDVESALLENALPLHINGGLTTVNENEHTGACAITHPTEGSLSDDGTRKRQRHMSKKQMEILASLNQFQTSVKKAFIDVWWLFDDGGLGLLIPHLLTLNRSYLDGAKLRVFTVSSSRSQLQREQRSMAALLSRFRIDYSDVYVIPDLAKKPSPSTIEQFENLVYPFRIANVSDSPNGGVNSNGDEDTLMINAALSPGQAPCGANSTSEVFITDSEYKALKNKTYRQLRTHELLMQHSKEASLIVLTLPIPRKGAVSAALYLSWLEFLTQNLPPTLLLRGNQQS
uniref:Solute carrier family 12 member 2 n=1 Tax=Romanomermis culicivorax TaxID=13658 RepID=A0A915KTG1_ROMCU